MSTASGTSELAKRVVVGLDIADGAVVKCVKFLNETTIGDPATLGLAYASEGADELVYLDIAASLSNRSKMLQWIERTAESVFIPFSVVGGVRKIQDFRDILLAGADKVGLNTGAVATPTLLDDAASKFGSQCVILTIDAKQSPDGFPEVYTHSGRTPTGMHAIEWAIEAERRGAGEIVFTAIDRDGTLEGFDIATTREMSSAVGIPVVASGGAGNAGHVAEVLTEGLADAALVASLVHYDMCSIADIKDAAASRGVAVRLTK